MSSGNLYRYFKSKKDVCADCGSRVLQQRLELIQKTINNKKLNPDEKLKTSVLEVLNYMHYHFSKQPALMELVDFISLERWDIVQEHMEQEKLLISEILFQGKKLWRFHYFRCTRNLDMGSSRFDKIFLPMVYGGF